VDGGGGFGRRFNGVAFDCGEEDVGGCLEFFWRGGFAGDEHVGAVLGRF